MNWEDRRIYKLDPARPVDKGINRLIPDEGWTLRDIIACNVGLWVAVILVAVLG